MKKKGFFDSNPLYYNRSKIFITWKLLKKNSKTFFSQLLKQKHSLLISILFLSDIQYFSQQKLYIAERNVNPCFSGKSRIYFSKSKDIDGISEKYIAFWIILNLKITLPNNLLLVKNNTLHLEKQVFSLALAQQQTILPCCVEIKQYFYFNMLQHLGRS